MYGTRQVQFVCVVYTSTQVFTLSHTHLLYTDPTLLEQILKLSIHRGDLDFIRYLVNNLSVDVNGELNDIHYFYSCMHTHKTVSLRLPEPLLFFSQI